MSDFETNPIGTAKKLEIAEKNLSFMTQECAKMENALELISTADSGARFTAKECEDMARAVLGLPPSHFMPRE